MGILAERVKELREGFGLSQADLAKRAGMTQQAIQAIEAGKVDRPTKIRELARALRAKPEYLLGETDIEHERTREDPAAPSPDEMEDFDPDAGTGNAALIGGIVVYQGKLPGSQPETMAKGGAGMGQVGDSGVASIRSNGIASGHAVAAEWVIPPSFLRHGLGGQPSATIIVPVIGHSMEPRLNEGDRVIVDVSQNEWIGDAIYLIDDGGTVFQAKTLRKITSSHPPRYLVISEADREHPDERDGTQFRIVGRVVGRISRA